MLLSVALRELLRLYLIRSVPLKRGTAKLFCVAFFVVEVPPAPAYYLFTYDYEGPRARARVVLGRRGVQRMRSLRKLAVVLQGLQ